MLSILNEWYVTWCNSGEPLVKNWFLIKSPIPMLLISLTYLTIVFFGQKLMKNKSPLDLRKFMFIYNCAVVIASAYIAIGSIRAVTSVPNFPSALYLEPQNLSKGPGYQVAMIFVTLDGLASLFVFSIQDPRTN
ncbi:hypothetical protein MXB_2108 [Myxobolus squamalis]|nr:hypothetical protein MXB_2108 [Myxobolus squamalis]